MNYLVKLDFEDMEFYEKIIKNHGTLKNLFEKYYLLLAEYNRTLKERNEN